MQKRYFDEWNEQKFAIHEIAKNVSFSEGEVWRCSLGINICSEAFGKGESFRRPVLILKKFSHDTCICIPLGSQKKEGTWFYEYIMHWKLGYAMLYKVKMIHTNRLQRKMGEMSILDFVGIKKKLQELLGL